MGNDSSHALGVLCLSTGTGQPVEPLAPIFNYLPFSTMDDKMATSLKSKYVYSV